MCCHTPNYFSFSAMGNKSFACPILPGSMMCVAVMNCLVLNLGYWGLHVPLILAVIKDALIYAFLTRPDCWCMWKVLVTNINAHHLVVYCASILNKTSIKFVMFTFTGRENKQTKCFSTNLTWINYDSLLFSCKMVFQYYGIRGTCW